MTFTGNHLDSERALTTRFLVKTTTKGWMSLPTDPSRLEEYVSRCVATFATLGVEFSTEDTDHLRVALSTQLDQALINPEWTDLVVSYDIPPGLVVNYRAAASVLTPAAAAGEIKFPAVPSMLEEYVRRCLDMFATLGASFTEEETDHLRGVLREELNSTFVESSRSDIVFTYDMPTSDSTRYHVVGQGLSIEAAYDEWMIDPNRQPSLFGTAPDARIWNLAADAADPAECLILDIGAGTGRNSLALARKGHPVDAVEMSQGFAGMLHDAAQQEGLEHLRVIPTDMADAEAYMYEQYSLIVLSEVVSDFRTVDQVREVFELAARRLAPGGILVLNAFLPKPGYLLTDAARELGQRAYTSIFTREELETAAGGLGLDLVSEESVYGYEKANLDPEHWPPTNWYENWTSGLDVFSTGDRDTSPIDMLWLTYRKS